MATKVCKRINAKRHLGGRGWPLATAYTVDQLMACSTARAPCPVQLLQTSLLKETKKWSLSLLESEVRISLSRPRRRRELSNTAVTLEFEQLCNNLAVNRKPIKGSLGSKDIGQYTSTRSNSTWPIQGGVNCACVCACRAHTHAWPGGSHEN